MKIISGKYKGLKINITKKKILKPTTSIIKKIIFEWIKPFIKKSTFLDCFAGTASLSIESLSMGAKYAYIIEKNYQIFNNIKKNIKKIKNKNIKIYNLDCIKWIKKNKKIKFDIIFLDPPYNYLKINNILNIIIKNKIIKKNSIIYIEISKKNKYFHITNEWKIYKNKKIHSTEILLIKRI